MSGDTTAVYVHESRFPLRILKHLARAGPPGTGSQIKRLDPLFRYEANVHEDSPKASTSYNPSTVPTSSNSSHNARINTSSSLAQGRQPTASTASETGSDKHVQPRSDTEKDWGHSSEILTFESPIEGVITEWCAPEGQLLLDP